MEVDIEGTRALELVWVSGEATNDLSEGGQLVLAFGGEMSVARFASVSNVTIQSSFRSNCAVHLHIHTSIWLCVYIPAKVI